MASFKAIGNFLSQNILNRTLWASAYISCVSDMASQPFVSLPLSSPSPSLSHYILTAVSTPPSPPPSAFPQFHSSSISIQKRAGLPGIETEHSITRYSKARHKPSHQGWTRQPSRRKRSQKQVLRADERVILNVLTLLLQPIWFVEAIENKEKEAQEKVNLFPISNHHPLHRLSRLFPLRIQEMDPNITQEGRST